MTYVDGEIAVLGARVSVRCLIASSKLGLAVDGHELPFPWNEKRAKTPLFIGSELAGAL
jgi:hypothetical protein